MHVDICSKCHPFFTGKKQAVTDRGGRIEQFKKRYGVASDDSAGNEAGQDEEVAPAAQV